MVPTFSRFHVKNAHESLDFIEIDVLNTEVETEISKTLKNADFESCEMEIHVSYSCITREGADTQQDAYNTSLLHPT